MTSALGIASDGLLDRNGVPALHIAVRGLLQTAADGAREVVRNIVEAIVARSIVVRDRPQTSLASVMATIGVDMTRLVHADALRLSEAFVEKYLSAEASKTVGSKQVRNVNATSRRSVAVRRR